VKLAIPQPRKAGLSVINPLVVIALIVATLPNALAVGSDP
jgi:hypothetical protein